MSLATTDAPSLAGESLLAPGACAVTGDIDGPFIDSGRYWRFPYAEGGETPRIYLHAPWVEEVARDVLGMVPKEDVADLEKRYAEQGQELRALKVAFDALA